MNVGDAERLMSIVGGAALALAGVRRRSAGGAALALVAGTLLHRGVTGRSAVYGAFGIDTSDGERPRVVRRHGPNAVVDAERSVRVERAVTIACAPRRLYDFWRRLENLPRIMRHLESVTTLGPTRSRWRAKLSGGQRVEWEAEIINDVPAELIAWRSVEGAQIPNAGSVHFMPLPADRGTMVRVEIELEPPAGALGVAAMRVLRRDPDGPVREDLRRFKQIMEAGEMPTTVGQPSCRA